VTCSELLYAMELVDGEVVDVEFERTTADVVIEVASGFFYRREQRTKMASLAESARPGAAGTVAQIIMGAGKTSFIVPGVIMGHMMKLLPAYLAYEPPTALVLVPQALVTQTSDVLRQIMCSFSGIEIVAASKERDDLRALFDPRGINIARTKRLAGTIFIVGDKVAQRYLLTHADATIKNADLSQSRFHVTDIR
jgi:hypothetical protein